MKKKAFTLIEILVVVTIISLLAAGAYVNYSSINNKSFDEKRKADIEQIRMALEMYYNNNSTYPPTLPSNSLIDGAGRVYLNKIPKDPKYNNFYSYTTQPTGCDGSSSNPCVEYTLTAVLSNNNLYIADNYGSQEVTPTQPPHP